MLILKSTHAILDRLFEFGCTMFITELLETRKMRHDLVFCSKFCCVWGFGFYNLMNLKVPELLNVFGRH